VGVGVSFTLGLVNLAAHESGERLGAMRFGGSSDQTHPTTHMMSPLYKQRCNPHLEDGEKEPMTVMVIPEASRSHCRGRDIEGASCSTTHTLAPASSEGCALVCASCSNIAMASLGHCLTSAGLHRRSGVAAGVRAS
jgi:hypothetical protein